MLVRPLDERSVDATVRELGLVHGRPVMIVVGGAAGLDAALEPQLTRLFTDAVFPAAERRRAAIVDGGTDSGVMRLAGAARQTVGGDVPLVGVVAEGTTTWGGSDEPGAVALEPNHTHVILVPGREWGDESPWIPRIAGSIAGGAPVVAVVIGGGDVTERDVQNIAQRRTTVIAVRGTGGVADQLDDSVASRFVAVDALASPQVLFDRLMSELATDSNR